MASSSNSSLALVTSSRRNYYDVFITFRGEDTRNNFTDFLFDALQTKGILVFRDDTNLQKGEFIGPELFRAIEGSQIFVAVFSKNYASSTWCLQELAKICECVKGSRKLILPVFYDVDPSEVRKQSGIYGEAFIKHEQRFQQEFHMVSKWRDALTQVGSISGWDLCDKPQAREIKTVVQKIINTLQCKSSCVSKDLVAIDSRLEALQNHFLLDSVDGVRAIGIWGMGGIGKTTLAMNLYGQISHRFDASCFIEDVSKIYRLHDGPIDAQKQILHQTLGIEHHQICNRYNATYFIRRRLRHIKVLLILDNVDQVEQLEKIGVHREWLGAGSSIVIISRDEHILKEYGVDGVYKVPLLNHAESYKLFCRKAFKIEKIIMSDYQNLADEILNYAEGLPLAITILGSFLFGRNVTEWKSALARLRESPDKNVMDVLQLSFDGLEEETEKEIFLDIACFFKSFTEKYVKNILNFCGFHADVGLRVLIDKSLISINSDSAIEIHSLLEELGRKIVQNSSSKEPRKWSRLWSAKQFYNVKMENMEKHVEAIVLDDEEVDVEHLLKMSNLRLLIIGDRGHISGSPSKLSFSNKLRYVEWHEYPFKYLPSSFHPNELVELILATSSITHLWKNKKNLPNLRILDLSDSTELENIIDFGEFPNLEWLNLKGCSRLVELDPSIGLLTKLVHLNLKGCSRLVQLDPSIGLLRKLVSLNLKYCENLVSIPNNIFDLGSLKYLNMQQCSKAFKNGSTSSVFKYLLPSLHSSDCLRYVDISFCNLSQVPNSIECLCSLESLNLGGNNFVTLPSLRKLSKLVYLNLEHCKLLECLPQLPTPTTMRERDEFEWYEYDKRECCYNTVFEMSEFEWIRLVIFNCPKLGERECCYSMAFSWMKQFIMANPQSFKDIQIVFPGSEIPSWINNQSMGDSIQIDESPIWHDKNNNIIGFVCCAVFTMEPHPECFSWANMKLSFNHRIKLSVPVILNGGLVTTKSSHLWIIYVPRESYYYFKTIPQVIGGSLFELLSFDIDGDECLGMEVKSCGYRWVCKQDLQEFNLPMINHENSLAPKCKILAIEDGTQPQSQRQPEQESFISQGTETEVSVEVPDSPVGVEVSTESPQKKFSNLHIIGRFIGRFLNNCCQQGSTDTDTDTVNSDAESLVSEEDSDAVTSIIEEAIQTDIATGNVESDSPVELADEVVIERKKLQLQLRQTAM